MGAEADLYGLQLSEVFSVDDIIMIEREMKWTSFFSDPYYLRENRSNLVAELNYVALAYAQFDLLGEDWSAAHVRSQHDKLRTAIMSMYQALGLPVRGRLEQVDWRHFKRGGGLFAQVKPVGPVEIEELAGSEFCAGLLASLSSMLDAIEEIDVRIQQDELAKPTKRDLQAYRSILDLSDLYSRYFREVPTLYSNVDSSPFVKFVTFCLNKYANRKNRRKDHERLSCESVRQMIRTVANAPEWL